MGIIKRIKNVFTNELDIGQITTYKASDEFMDKLVKGDGKAIFIGEGSEEEYKEMEKERKGLKGIFGAK